LGRLLAHSQALLPPQLILLYSLLDLHPTLLTKLTPQFSFSPEAAPGRPLTGLSLLFSGLLLLPTLGFELLPGLVLLVTTFPNLAALISQVRLLAA
jgi:hypothetical protein